MVGVFGYVLMTDIRTSTTMPDHTGSHMVDTSIVMYIYMYNNMLRRCAYMCIAYTTYKRGGANGSWARGWGERCPPPLRLGLLRNIGMDIYVDSHAVGVGTPWKGRDPLNLQSGGSLR